MKNFYDRPTQVMFWDYDKRDWNYGIAYGEEIICGCCGGIFEIAEVLEIGKDDGVQNPIHEYENWVDISYEIFGGEVPESFNIELSIPDDEEEATTYIGD